VQLAGKFRVIFIKLISTSVVNETHILYSLHDVPCHRVAKDLEDRRTYYEPSIGVVPDEVEHAFKLEEHDFVPHFQRVSVSGEDTSGVSNCVLCGFSKSGRATNLKVFLKHHTGNKRQLTECE